MTRAAAPARRATFDPAQQRRRAMLAKVHIAPKQMGMTEDDYRAIVLKHSGSLSAKDATEKQLQAILDEFQAKGWKPINKAGGAAGSARRAPAADHPVARKARAMWVSLHQLGVVRNPSEGALEAFAARQLGCVAMRWSDQAMGYRLIEALKAMAERAGWSQQMAGNGKEADVRELRRRLAKAITAKLATAGIIPMGWTAATALYQLTGDDRLWTNSYPSSEDYAVAAQMLGRVLAERAPSTGPEA
jgi:phage gp16-like protein